MDFDWCPEEKLEYSTKFNENSIISQEKKNIKSNDNNEIKNEIMIDKCFDIEFKEILDKKNILNILNYLSLISDHLRKFIRNKSQRFQNTFNNFIQDDFDMVLKYLNWLKNASNNIKKYFANPLRRDNSYDPNTIKLFKTSSYKFCNFKESCSIHKNKQSKCDKNHFVFDMIINDITKLIDSINIIGLDNFNSILSNVVIKITFDAEKKNYNSEKILNNYTNTELNETQFVIDKTIIFKSFDVISFVLNKMYEESQYFLLSDNLSQIINLD